MTSSVLGASTTTSAAATGSTAGSGILSPAPSSGAITINITFSLVGRGTPLQSFAITPPVVCANPTVVSMADLDDVVVSAVRVACPQSSKTLFKAQAQSVLQMVAVYQMRSIDKQTLHAVDTSYVSVLEHCDKERAPAQVHRDFTLALHGVLKRINSNVGTFASVTPYAKVSFALSPRLAAHRHTLADCWPALPSENLSNSDAHHCHCPLGRLLRSLQPQGERP